MQKDLSKNVNIIDYGRLTNTKDSRAVTFDSEEGQRCFNESKYKTLFFHLAQHYAPQQHITTCGIASAIMILNSIYYRANKKCPLAINSSLYLKEENIFYSNHIWDEDNIFCHDKVSNIKLKDLITGKVKVENNYDLGISLASLTEFLNLYSVNATCYNINNKTIASIDNFRSVIKQVTQEANSYIIANYNLTILDNKLDNGHFSPIAAYDETSDRVLILDTWAAFTPWIWVELTSFYVSMNTLDKNNYRGYILVSP